MVYVTPGTAGYCKKKRVGVGGWGSSVRLGPIVSYIRLGLPDQSEVPSNPASWGPDGCSQETIKAGHDVSSLPHYMASSSCYYEAYCLSI